ncbi:MAG: TlpA family protein disulfide reductase, partial [Planctomycetota bacterium]|jgi:thiol-disulfide isomerase/thioredoxin
VSLKEAVAEFNENVAEYFARLEGYPSSSYKKDNRPAPLTEDEIVSVIRGWDRDKMEVRDETYRIYQKIAESRTLPARAKLHRVGLTRPEGKYDYRVWAVNLEVMTGESTGYGLRVREEKLPHTRTFAVTPGYSWILGPEPITRGGSAGGVVFSMDEDPGDVLAVTVAWLHGQDMVDLRVVAFDEEGNRYLLARRGLPMHENLTMSRFRLDPNELPRSSVYQVGIEAMDRYGIRLVSEVAVRRAREKGIEVLPLPQVDRPYKFALTATDGRVIDSRELQGKVVLIDCWASWCGPCMREMPELKRIYDKWHAEGLEVVGLSLDEDVEAAEAAFERLEIPWPLVVVPADREVRGLWNEAARITTLPRILLVDQRGVLRVDAPKLEQADEEIAALLRGS